MSAVADSASQNEIFEALRLAQTIAATAENLSSAGKRAAEEIANGEQPAKRSANGEDVEMDVMGNPIATLGGVPGNIVPQMGGGIVFEQLDVPDQSVGMIIGRGGENISNIQAVTNCRVQMSPETNEMGMRNCTLQGTRDAVEKAKAMILEVVQRASARPPPNRRDEGGNGGMGVGGGGGFGGPPQDMMGGGGGRVITEEMLVPGPKCGLIIGKGGETIKQIQERAGVKIVLIQDSQEVSSSPKPLRITGEPDKVEFAKALCEEVMNSKDDLPPGRRMPPPAFNDFGMSPGPRSIGEVIVPRNSVGTIIGKGGETIKRLVAESGARIQFKKDESQDAPERTAVLQGTPDQIQRATQMISDLVNRSMQMDGQDGGGGRMGGGGGGGAQDTYMMRIPASKAGLVIGRGGDTINQICRDSGANIQLSRETGPNATEKIFTIKGAPHQIQHAQHIIRSKVGDAVIGPPYQGGGGGGGAPGGAPFGQYGGAGAFGAPQGGAWPGAETAGLGGDAAAWAQYYAQQQQQQQYGAPGGGGYYGGGQPAPQPDAAHLAAAAVAAAQQPAAAAAPAVNPATGQPDYSAQWAEYYRTMGMHDQAAAIEQQAKANQAAAVAARSQAPNPGQPGAYNYAAAGGAPYGQPGAAPQPQFQYPQYQ